MKINKTLDYITAILLVPYIFLLVAEENWTGLAVGLVALLVQLELISIKYLKEWNE